MSRKERWIGNQKARDKLPASDQVRTKFQHDRDRILYTTALRRLSGVTQVVSAVEGTIFHNRLTHSLEVAQVARGIAQFLEAAAEDNPGSKAKIEAFGGLNVDVVEAAALAHDLGHPPYGHLGEEELDAGVRKATGLDGDGFEGNAQSFRIVTRLAMRREKMYGLDLTRATLNAILKYPWLWSKGPPGYEKKWGAYGTEQEIFEWVRKKCGLKPKVKSLEAAIMDWADDITYALHDVEDFYRAGLIPLDVLCRSDGSEARERKRFVDGIFKRHRHDWGYGGYVETRNLADQYLNEIGRHEINVRYDGSPSLRRKLRSFISFQIRDCIQEGAKLGDEPDALETAPEYETKVAILKELTWHYVINGPELATQRHGQKRIIRDLFKVSYKAIKRGEWWTLPTGYQRIVEEAYDSTTAANDDQALAARLAADFVAGLTEQQAVVLHRRVTGIDMGPLFNSLP